jgi:hypothetical protein
LILDLHPRAIESSGFSEVEIGSAPWKHMSISGKK